MLNISPERAKEIVEAEGQLVNSATNKTLDGTSDDGTVKSRNFYTSVSIAPDIP